MDEDIVQEFVLSSDGEDGSLSDNFSAEEDEMEKPAPSKPKHSTNKSKQNAKPQAKRSKKRKTVSLSATGEESGTESEDQRGDGKEDREPLR
ncbi:unnamed protein product [Malus baccata var. baccata]